MHQIFAIGYSTRPIDGFINLLAVRNIEMLVDIRTIAKSRHCPDYNEQVLELSLRERKIGYRRLKELGGLRHPKKDSANIGWTNPSFRGFADYMQTAGFKRGLVKLEKIANQHRTVIMCAEGNPFRCHRTLIADALTVRHWAVFHVQSLKTVKLHEVTAFLRVKNGNLCYYP